MVTVRAHLDTLSKINVGTAATWRAAGLTRSQLAALVRAGELVKIRYGTYATSSLLAEAETDARFGHALHVASVTDRTRDGVASHHSAALMHGLNLLHKPPDKTVTLTVPPGTRTGRYGRGGVIRHNARLPGDHVTAVYGVPVTTVARTVVDIARTVTFMEGVVVADSALHDRHTSKTELRGALASCDRWPGVGKARKVIDFSTALSESVLESCARVVLHEQGLPPPELQVNILGRSGHLIARADFFWRQYGTIAEADGLLKYNERAAAIAELQRDRLLREAGFEVVHFTWHEVFSDSADVAARIRAAFDRSVRLGLQSREDAMRPVSLSGRPIRT